MEFTLPLSVPSTFTRPAFGGAVCILVFTQTARCLFSYTRIRLRYSAIGTGAVLVFVYSDSLARRDVVFETFEIPAHISENVIARRQ